ncbi:hypothetical protein BJY04DRAFT_190124 [Aspergillus karnatakaensis]|uniref:uncharacterized protein n=1 Tax=Aspergillus karnatakaensis TaxID=1810916 RepID=UPI003CCCE9FF
MSVTTTVSYPTDTTFDLEYYLAIHMPFVAETWGPFGLKEWKVVQFNSENAPYKIAAILTWESAESSATALKAEGSKAIFDDIAKFSDRTPVLASGDDVGSWKAGQ